MKDKYTNEDFEQYVKGHADQHRMYPSERVWSRLNNTLHPRKKWYGFGLAFLLLLTGGAVTWVMNTYPVKTAEGLGQISKPSIPATEKTEFTDTDLSDLIPFNREPRTVLSHLYEEPVIGPVPQLSAQQSLRIVHLEDGASAFPASALTDAGREVHRSELTIVHSSIPKTFVSPAIRPEINYSASEPPEAPAEKNSTARNNEVRELNQAPWSIESITNLYRAAPKKLSWQFFVTPTISYRSLSSNHDNALPIDPLFAMGSNFPFAASQNINNAVTHKPDFGMQLGFLARYPLRRNLRLLGGFQFNINRYDIKAFSNNSGELARIELAGDNPTFSAWSSYRSHNGTKLNWLKNTYFSVSAPVGAELIVHSSKSGKTDFAVAGTIQPTLVIQSKGYLISTDYKNYAQVPWLNRELNLNTGFEASIQHKKGKTQWQLGPQVRYQLLSSYHKKYPIRENLFDFGVKFGVTLNQ